MPELHGVRFDEATGLDFQQWYGKSRSSLLLGKMIELVTRQWTLRLMSVGSSTESMRQAQGALEALGEVDRLCEELGRMDMTAEAVESQDDGAEYETAPLEDSYV